MPIIGNIAKPTSDKKAAEQLEAKADELLTSSSGIYAGIAPTMRWPASASGYAGQIFGTLVVRANSLKDAVTDSSFSMSQARFSIGGIATLAQFDVGTGSFSAEFAMTRFRAADYQRAYGVERSHLLTTEAVLVLPIAENVGVLGQAVMNHTESRTVWRLGLALRPAKAAAAR